MSRILSLYKEIRGRASGEIKIKKILRRPLFQETSSVSYNITKTNTDKNKGVNEL